MTAQQTMNTALKISEKITIVNLKTIVDHCPHNFENHRKTIDTLKKTLTIPSL